MSQSYLTRRTVFGLPGALVILLIFFFLLPSAFRGARLAIAGKKNDIKDWLPSDFRETVELDWFAKYFMGESFVVATWDGCTTDDQRLALFSAKLKHESAQRVLPNTEAHQRARKLAEELRLFIEPSEMTNWGGLNEKWFSSPDGKSYYITPDGRFYRWEEGANAVGGLMRAIKRSTGNFQLKGQFLMAFGEPPERGQVNPFYNDPTLLAASLFQTVETGADLVSKLAVEGGPLWPIDLTDADQRANVARTRAIERLTGTLFAPAVPPNFTWTAEAIAAHVSEQTREKLPEDFEARVSVIMGQILERFGGSVEGLQHATLDEQGAAWDELFRGLGMDPPPRQTSVIVTLTKLGKDHLARAVGRGVVGAPRGRLLILADQAGLGAAPPPSMAPPPFDMDERELAAASGRTILRLGGPPIDNVSIDEEGTVTLIRLVGYSGVIGLVLSFICFRSFNLTLMIFICGLSAAILGLAIVYWTGGHVDAILMSMPSLVYVLGLSGAIHIVNYYRDEVRNHGAEGAAGRAIKHAWIPCTLASITTSLGLISLCTSNIVPIYNFGLYAALAVVATLLILFTYLPSALETFTPAFALRQSELDRADGANDPSEVDAIHATSHLIAEAWAAVGRFVTAHYGIVTVACLSVFAIGLMGIPKIRTSVQLLKLFDPDSRIIDDYAYLEENFGKLVPMELVIRVPEEMQSRPAGADVVASDDYPLSLLERAEAVARFDTAVRRTLGESGTGVVGRTMSATTFLPPLPEPSTSYSPTRQRFESRLSASVESLPDTDYFRVEDKGPFAGSELWRISLRVGALSDVDYGQFVGDLRKTVTPVLDAYRARSMILAAADSPPKGGDNGDGSESGKDSESAAPTDDISPTTKRQPPRILLIGSSEPKRMEVEDFLAIDDGADRDTAIEAAVKLGRQSDLIRQDRLFLSTLGELLSGERIKRPLWVDFDSGQSKIKPGTPQWDKLIEAMDVVVLVDEQESVDTEQLIAKAKRFVDVRLGTLPVAEAALVDSIPSETNAAPLQAIYTGIVPVVYKAQRTLLTSLIESIFLAFFLIAFVMIALLIPGRLPGALLRPKLLGCGVMAGLIAMVPNLFPVVVIFGMMGHGNVLVDIGTMMTASVAMGVAVDDTIHFLTFFRDYINRGMTRVEAVIETYRRVGPAMTQTTIVGGLGLFVFALSTFTPTQRFGTLMLVLLAAALVGDLILLPALLAGPLGRWFRPRPPVAGAQPDIGPPQFGAGGSNESSTVDSAKMDAVSGELKSSQVEPSKVSAKNRVVEVDSDTASKGPPTSVRVEAGSTGTPEPMGNRKREKRISTER
jgi:predicted RND superfamily exporter protein